MRIVFVCPPHRKDFYQYITNILKLEHEVFLLWEYKLKPETLPNYDEGIMPLYWSNYATPKELLEKIKPDRVIFFEIIDLWQIPLIVTCHKFKVKTFFVEHGVGNSVELVIGRFNEIPSLKERLALYAKKIFYSLPRIIKNRYFFVSAAQYLPAKDIPNYFRLTSYFKKYTPFHALSKLKFRNRTPHFALLFNRNNIDPFLLYNEIESQNIIIEGVPFFDKYFLREVVEKDHIVFIEHPYLEEGILNWDNKWHEKIARSLERFAIDYNVSVIVKLHPRSVISNWTRYNLSPLIEIKQKEDVTNDMLTAKLVLGYSSTLINALVTSKKNVVLLGWHPNPVIFGDDFSKSGLCHASFKVEELFEKYNYWLENNLTFDNKSALENFIKEYNFPFDGKATERIIEAIKNS